MRRAAGAALLALACVSVPTGGAVQPSTRWCAGETEPYVERISADSADDTPMVLVWCGLDATTVDGISTLWDDETGRLMMLMTYDRGVAHGPVLFWYENGQLEQCWVNIRGMPQGPTTMWHENGKLKARSQWLDGKFDGVWESYDESGALRKSWRFRRGEIVTDR